MRSNDIADFISLEGAHERTDKVVDVFLNDGKMLQGYLYYKDQDIPHFTETNQWNFITLNGDKIRLNGDDVKELKLE